MENQALDSLQVKQRGLQITMKRIEQDIRSFINENFFVTADEAALPATTSLTASGTVDYMGVLELIMFIEQSYGFKIPDSETVPENLDTISSIVSYVESKSGIAVPA